ncbi:MAG: FecR family protein, partial [Chitinophagaceae bacterium]|nr:FecR family protein [Chitinophagaceae bacterium]
MSTPSHIADLLIKRLAETLTEQEQNELKEWAAQSPGRLLLLTEMTDNEQLQFDMLTLNNQKLSETREATLLKIKKQITTPARVPVHRIHFLKTTWFKYAAAILIVAGIGAYLWNTQQKDKPLITTNKPVPVKNDVSPGYDRATLTLSDGKKVELNNDVKETITDGSLSIKNNKGQLTYTNSERGSLSPAGGSTPGKAGREGGPVSYNTMSTPKGGTYRLTLPDGTEAWLNAASSITFPTVFIEKERTVTITGEVYFDVAKNPSKPFIVKSATQTITVLGTSFNIKSYPDEESAKTTLIDGSIQLKTNKTTKILIPGQQAINKNQNINITTNINLQEIIAWKNGDFYFDNRDLKSILNEFARWYDVEVVYPDNLK